MKVLHFFPQTLTADGGPALSVRGWARGMARAGADVSVACAGGNMAGKQEGVTFRSIALRMRHSLQYPKGLKEILPGHDVLFLHSGWTPYNLWGARLARQAGVPYVLVPHGAYEPEVLARSRATKLLWRNTSERTVIEGASAVHVFFEGEQRNISAVGADCPVLVAPNAVDVPSDRRWDGGSGGYLLWIGRYDIHHKGLDILIDAFSRLPTPRPPLVMRGTGEEGRADLERYAEKRGVHDVLIEGPVEGDDKWDHLCRARAFAFASRYDSHSIAIMEAAALGVPIAAANNTYVGHYLASEGAAAGAPAEPDAFASALAEVLSDEGVRYGATAGYLVRSSVSWESSARNLLRQLEAVL